MNLFAYLRRTWRKRNTLPQLAKARKAQLKVEALEDRWLPSGNIISGYVYVDANNNGLYDPGEIPIANSTIQLRDGFGATVGATSTDANGYYQFAVDVTITRTMTVKATPTDWTTVLTAGQFNPALGTLTSVAITNAGSFTSDFKVESLENVTATVSGVLTLTGPGVAGLVTNSSASQTCVASALDSSSLYDFGNQTTSGTNNITLTAASDLANYLGTGTVALSEVAHATSNATGSGNLLSQITTSAAATVTIVYNYIPSYTIVETSVPPSYLEGLQSSNSVVIPNSVGNDVIPVTLHNGSAPNNDFGKLLPASLAGFVYVDANDNGVKDPGESGVGGVTVTMTGANDLGPVSQQQVVTAADGSYQFQNLRPGTYILTETQPANHLQGRESLGSAGGTLGNNQFSAIALAPGTTGANYNFGELLPSSLSGFAYVDANDNGVKDPGESGIGAVTVSLTGANDLGSVSQTVVTAADGSYQFQNLRPGTYSLADTQPTGYLPGKDTLGSAGGALANNLFAAIPLPSGTSGTNYNFGELVAASLAGFVYLDANNNGSKDPGEAGISGVTVTLTGTNDLGAVANLTQTTAADGSYSYSNLRPGVYALTKTPSPGYLDGKEALGSSGGALGLNQFSAIALTSAASGVNYDFGEVLPPSISGFVYLDLNDNGLKDTGEAGIPGVTVTLTGASATGAAVSQIQTTATDGSYHFLNVPPGTYSLQETHPAGYLDGKDSAGSAGGTVGNDQLSNIVLGVNITAVNNNFAELTPARLSGFVYLDSNNDGIFEANESGIAGVTVTLSGANDQGNPVNSSQQTGPDGSYSFSNLRPGTYALAVTQPAAYVAGKDTLGSAGGSLGTSQFTAIGLAMGVAGANYNFGELLTSQSTGLVYADSFTQDASFSIPPLAILSKIQFLSSSGPQADPVLQADATFVNGVYEALLGRQVDPVGLIAWVQQLNNGVPRVQIVQAIAGSAEHLSLVVNQLYETFLHRTADAGGQAFWVNQLMSGLSASVVARMIIDSGEYQSAHADNATYVSGLYSDILGRTATAGEVAGWVQSLRNGASRDAVAAAFLGSGEADLQIIDRDYSTLLNRGAGAAEEQGWMLQLQNGNLSPQGLAIAFLASDEFFARAQAASIE